MLKKETDTFIMDYLVCPACTRVCKIDDQLLNVDTAGDLLSGLVYGYYLTCQHCGKKSFLNVLGKPPLFDLSKRRLF